MGVSVCEFTYNTIPSPIRAGANSVVMVEVTALDGTDVTFRARTLDGFVDPDLSLNDVTRTQ